MKEYNEYSDKLVGKEVAMLAKEVGYDVQEVECFSITDEVPKDAAHIYDEWSGMIGEGNKFLCYRPTQSALQKWIREKHGITVESNFLANIQKYRSFYKPKNIIPKTFRSNSEYHIAVERYYSKVNYETYEEALEDGLTQALMIIKD